jgi:hypothetical protein
MQDAVQQLNESTLPVTMPEQHSGGKTQSNGSFCAVKRSPAGVIG